jgi:hypothetical protein
MAAQDSAKRGQVPEMKSATETISNASAPNASVPPQGVVLEPDLQAHIGRQLRAVYEEVVNEEVPERFIRLLEELERKKADGV